ncbi:MAG TPA: fumarylacetoacetase [Gemmatimonadaceae bacterium]|nr:fumarylacetoacetase [Gemmatimonadaceae bacterium]
MIYEPDETHDPERRSWVESANETGGDFPIQNLPFGVFAPPAGGAAPRVGVAIGDRILDLSVCARERVFGDEAAEAAARCAEPSLNALMALGPGAWRALRRQVSEFLGEDGEGYENFKRLGDVLIVPRAECELFLPAIVGDYTDFYASIHHATNVGRMFRPDNPLLPNYKYVPIAYHGRASSLVASGTPVHRPSGQRKAPDDEAPEYGPTRLLDYEAELGVLVGVGNTLGETIPIDRAPSHLFGVCLVNDWSARDIQAWEYQPLGPFLAKSFATTLSPWVVTLDALAPFRIPALQRADGDPAPLSYLHDADDQRSGGIDVTIEVWLRTRSMRESGATPVRLSQASFSGMYWTVAQMLTHHASNGCNLRPGDLFASGTISGPGEGSRGCLLELTSRGANPLRLPGGETRKFLEDGDEVILHGFCEREGYARIGLGECTGEVIAAG